MKRITSPARMALVLAGLLLTAQALAAEVIARLDRDRIVEGETVTLVLQTHDTQQKLDFDFSQIEAEFRLLDRRTETQMSISGGRQTAVVRQLLTLEPKRSGELTIPALDVGGETTRPLSLRVEPAPEPQPGELPAVFIEVEVEPQHEPYYVHAQLGLVVRVYYQQNLTEAAISQPEPSPASVRLLDEVPYHAERNGERYRVLERHYAIFPERSGAMTIPPLRLSGRLVERRSDRLWQPSVRGRRIQVESDPLTLDVLPRPPEFTGDNWQPARGYEVSQQISGGDQLRVGEPVTRTVIIDAVGMEENMIAEPAWPEIENARIYPDQPQGISRDDGRWVLGHKEFRYAVVPETDGDLVLPRLEIAWWDTIENVQRRAVLPEQVLRVAPAAPIPGAAAAVAEVSQAAPAVVPQPGGESPLWRWATLAFAVLWLATLGLFLRGGGTARRPRKTVKGSIDENESERLRSLRRACEAGDAAAARKALSSWLLHHGPDAGSGSLLQFAGGRAEDKLRSEIYRLDGVGYRQGSDENWSGKELLQAFNSWRNEWQKQRGLDTAEVTDLYARRNRVA